MWINRSQVYKPFNFSSSHLDFLLFNYSRFLFLYNLFYFKLSEELAYGEGLDCGLQSCGQIRVQLKVMSLCFSHMYK